MPHASNVKKTDIKRAMTAVIATGLRIARIEVAKDGSFAVIPGMPAAAPKDDETLEDLSKLL